MAHKVLINGTAYEVKPSPVLIDGTKYQIGGGRTLVGGTGYDISFAASLVWEIGHSKPTLSPFTANTKFENIPFHCPNTGLGYTEIDLYGAGTLDVIYFTGKTGTAMIWNTYWYVSTPVRLEFESAPTGDLLAWLKVNGVEVKE